MLKEKTNIQNHSI